jgi:hypothetical protein
VFRIRFAPGAGSDGNEDALLTVATTDALQPTLDLPVTGARRMQRTPADQSVAIGAVPTGAGSPGVVTLTNAGARPVTYTTANFPANVTVAPAMPLTLAAGESRQVTVTVTPQATGAFSVTATLLTQSPCIDSTRITVTGTAAGGSRQTSAQYGTIAACGVSQQTITFVNGDGQTVRIFNIHPSGADSSFFVLIAPTSFPIDVAAGDSVHIIVEFRPASATRSYSARCVTSLTAGGKDISVISQLDGASALATMTAALPLDAGQGQVGTLVSTPVTVTNTSPFPVTITTATLTTMTVRSTTPALPATIQPGGTLQITVEWTPQTVGAVTDTLVLRESAPCDLRMVFATTGQGLPSNIVTTALSIPALEGKIDDHILIPVQSSVDLGSTGATSWSGAVRFNRTMLFPLRVVKEGTLSADMPNVTMSYDHKTGTVSLAGGGAAVRAGAGALVYVEALVLLGNDSQSPVAIDPGFDFTSGRARVATRTDGVFNLIGYCLCGGNRLLKVEGAYQLKQNHPNPFNPSTEIEYAIAIEGAVRMTVHDAWGRETATLVNEYQQPGRYTVRFDASALPSGVYYYRLVSGRFSETRKMIVSK